MDMYKNLLQYIFSPLVYQIVLDSSVITYLLHEACECRHSQRNFNKSQEIFEDEV